MAQREQRSRPAGNRAADVSAANRDGSSLARPSDTTRQPRRWTVVIESRHCAHVSGYGAREMLTEMRGRPPLWSSVSRAWVTTEDTARDLIARAERRGIQVDVESYVSMSTTRTSTTADVADVPVEVPLW